VFDNHIHCHELPAEELEEYRREWTLVCVSDDLATSKKTLEMEGVVRCLGIHPWQVEKAEPGDLSTVLKLLERRTRGLSPTALTNRGSTSEPSYARLAS